MINLKVHKDILENFDNSYEDIQRYLDEPNVIYNAKTITNRMILDTFINGKYAHTDKNKLSERKNLSNTCCYNNFFLILDLFWTALNNGLKFFT